MYLAALRSARGVLVCSVIGLLGQALCAAGRENLSVVNIYSNQGVTVTVSASGVYRVSVDKLAWSFAGAAGHILTNITPSLGTDLTGAYRQIDFDYTVDAPRHASIRGYMDKMAVLFSVAYGGPSANSAPFPTFATYPILPKHLAFAGPFAVPSFFGYAPDSAWSFFDAQANTFIISPASNFMTAQTSWGSQSEITAGIASAITTLPAGFTQSTLLVIDQGVNQTFDSWGRMMTDLQGKHRPANDADASLNLLGYWTDNGGFYYYHKDPVLSYQDTLAAVKAGFDQQGITLGYMQLDSWFYPKGPNQDWTDFQGGIFQYAGADKLFSPDLKSFQQRLGVPLVTHARWVDAASPYRQQYKMSGNVVTDPLYWNNIGHYMQDAGVTTYEQDWLGDLAHADLNLTDPDAFMDNMAAGMDQNGITIQYCMATPRHFLQSTKYNNVTSIRTGEDRLNPQRWTKFLYSGRLASALGIWPYADVFMSSETNNMLIANLSAGPLGVGDALNALNKANLLRAVRTDGVIVKPDVPLTPIDASFFTSSADLNAPVVASTYSDFNGIRTYYVLSYDQGIGAYPAITLADIGLNVPAYVYDYFAGSGTVLSPSDAFPSPPVSNSFVYLVAAPIGPSGIAVIGDLSNFVSAGKKRITQLADDGAVHVTVAFAAGESSRIIHGYAPSAPAVAVSNGALVSFRFDPASNRFFVEIAPGSGQTASFSLSNSVSN